MRDVRVKADRSVRHPIYSRITRLDSNGEGQQTGKTAYIRRLAPCRRELRKSHVSRGLTTFPRLRPFESAKSPSTLSRGVMSVVQVLDGGFSTQLSTHVDKTIDGDPLWTARFLATDPEAVFATHLDFLRAGADIIQTNTYQATIDGFVKYLNIGEEESLGLISQAVDCAKRAVAVYRKECRNTLDALNKDPLIAGSCGPYGAALHDGSEYTGTYGSHVSTELLVEWHRPRVRALLESGVDLLALETIPCKHEAEALVSLLREFPHAKAWLSFSCRDDGRSIADGSDFKSVATDCYRRAPPGQLLAVGMNCIAPQNVAPFIDDVNSNCAKNFVPLVLYPNSGEKYTVKDGWKREGKCYAIEEFVGGWLDLGVRYIGGCCRTYATDVKKIRAEVERWKKK